MNKTIELRNLDVELVGSKETDGSLFVSGYVNKTEQLSQPLGRKQKFVEKIERGTFTRALQQGNEIHFLAEHDNEKILSSTRNGSLSLREDDQGLYMEARISDTSWGRDYHQLIQDGLLINMSFGMQVLNDTWTERDDGTLLRSISDLVLSEVSVVRNPAYIQSNIQARSIDVVDEPQINLMEESPMSKEKELQELRNKLTEMENEVREEQEQANTETRKAVEVDTKENELRGVEQFLKGDMLAPEVRALTTGSQAITVPKVLSNQIIEMVVEKADLFRRTKQHRPVSGTLEVLRKSKKATSAFIGEWDSAGTTDFTFDKVTLEQRRAVAAIELSQQLVNDSGIPIIDYTVNEIATALAEKLDESVLTGLVANKEFEGILSANVPASNVSTYKVGAGITVNDLNKMILNSPKKYAKDGIFIMSRPTFVQVASLQYPDGRFVLTHDVINNEPSYKIFGHEIVISEDMPTVANGKVAVIFINMAEAVNSMVKRGAQMKRISDDTTQAMRGSHLLMIDIYADSKIVNEKAIRFLKQEA
ncbi:phage major capsid protein [Bacillus cereus group sp. BfR-BA-01451]|uniref:phage major capsid protein n=1 Tax=Bacillus cereus group sp. BfR-BA-01451 TaxID=2920354 RepID=UPI001F597A79|nr:phage major capsid protein [Bacillus cereus group sp. BfR-BA-01451]